MKSKAAPKVITLIGSNGMHYSLLCKPDDELRKDQRFLELCQVVSFFFQNMYCSICLSF